MHRKKVVQRNRPAGRKYNDAVVAEQKKLCLDLRLMGLSYDKIRVELDEQWPGISAMTVRNRLAAAEEEFVRPSAESYFRELWLKWLLLWKANIQNAMLGDTRASAECRAVLVEQAKLLGLDKAYQFLTDSQSNSGSLDEEFAVLMAQLKLADK